MEGTSKEFYGHIIVENYSKDGKISLFKVDKSGARALSADGLLPLSGQHRCIMIQNCSIGVVLFEKQLDLEVCNGYIFLGTPACPIVKNRPKTIVVKGKYGFAKFRVSVFEYAIQAVVKVAFVPPSSSNLSKYTVCGQISAKYEHHYEHLDQLFGKYNSRLFELPEEEAMEISTALRDDARIVEIPLLRTAVCVPPDGFIIDTKLRVNGQIISGTLSFVPPECLFGDVDEYLKESSGYGQIKVSVTWAADHFIGK